MIAEVGHINQWYGEILSFSRQFLFNIFSSWYAHAVRVVIAFFFVPFITSIMGDSRYGVWVIVFQAISYFSILDLGMNAAVVRFISKHLGENNFDKINRVLNTATLFFFAIGVAAAGLIYYFSTNYFGIFQIDDPSLAKEGATAMAIMGLFVGIRFILQPFAGSFVAFHRQDLANLLNICEEIIRTFAIVLLLYHNYGLVELAQTVLVINVLKQILAVIVLKRLQGEIRFSLKLIDIATIKSLFDYSKTAFGIAVAWIVIFNSDSLLLGIVSSSASAGIFNPAVQAMYHLRMIVNAIGIPLTPAVSHLGVTTDIAAIAGMYLRALKYTSYLSFLICTGMVIYAEPFIALWLPASFLPAADVMKVLAISAAFYLPQILGNSILLGLDKHRYLLIVLFLEAGLKILLALVLIKPYGLMGMAIATAAPQLLLYTTIYPQYVSKVLGITYSQGMRPVLFTGLIAVFVTGVTAFVLHQWLPPWTWRSLIINVAIVVAANAIPAIFIVEKKDREKLVNLFRRRK